jgi:hypothetical protein
MFIIDIVQDLTMKVYPYASPIHSVDPDEVWHYIDNLTSLNYVSRLLRERVEKRFFGFVDNIDKLTKAKLIYNAENLSNEGNVVEIHQILSENNDIQVNAKEITLLARQAIELYRSSQTASIYARPIILYYSYSRLARILFLSVYKSEKATGKHGLSLKDGKSVICQKRGAFPRFHDSFNWSPSIYLQGCVFRWQDLLDGMINRYPLIVNMNRCNRIFLNEKKSNNTQFREHELTREYIFIYAMSMLARYGVEKWAKLIEGRESDIIWNIQQYMTSTQSLFPNLILNQLSGEQRYFYPLEPDVMGFTEVRPEELDWVL